MKKLKKIGLLSLVIATISLVSCTDPLKFFQEQFPEVNNLSDQIMIDGEVAIPILNSNLKLTNFLPNTEDSTVWIEIDQNQLIHLHLKDKNIISIDVRTLLNDNTISLNSPISEDSNKISSELKNVRIFNDLKCGVVAINDPKIIFTFKNQIPLRFFFRIDSIIFTYDTIQNKKLSENKNHSITAAVTPPSGTPVTQKNTIVTYDKNSPGFADLPLIFPFTPRKYKTYFTVGVPSDTIYHGLGEDTIKIDAEIDLPLDIGIIDLALGDTSNFNLLNNNENIDSIKLKVIIDNDIPIGGKFFMFLADTNAQGQADSIYLSLLGTDGFDFKPGITDTNGEPTGSQRSSLIISLSKDQVEYLKENNVSKLIYGVVINTYNSASYQNVKIYTYEKIHIKLGAKISYSINN